jgi:hypothetical protein
MLKMLKSLVSLDRNQVLPSVTRVANIKKYLLFSGFGLTSAIVGLVITESCNNNNKSTTEKNSISMLTFVFKPNKKLLTLV